MAWLCAAFLLVVTFFSSVFMTSEADHDCSGGDCPVCLEMQKCLGNFQLLGSSCDGCSSVSAVAVVALPTALGVRTFRAPTLTLQRLDVRFDE